MSAVAEVKNVSTQQVECCRLNPESDEPADCQHDGTAAWKQSGFLFFTNLDQSEFKQCFYHRTPPVTLPIATSQTLKFYNWQFFKQTDTFLPSCCQVFLTSNNHYFPPIHTHTHTHTYPEAWTNWVTSVNNWRKEEEKRKQTGQKKEEKRTFHYK